MYREVDGQVKVAWFRRAATTLVHANIVIAAAATGVALTTIAIADLPVEPLPVLFVFAATWFAYTVNRFSDRAEDSHNLPGRSAFIDRYGWRLLVMVALVYGGVVALVAWWEPRMIPVAMAPAVAIVLYATGAASRYFPIKNGFVGMMWAAIPLGMGVYYVVATTTSILLVATVVFVVIGVAAAVFDIKDIEGDRAVGSATAPVVAGPERTKRAAMVAIALTVPLIAWATVIVTPRFAVLGIYPAYLLIAIPFARRDRGPLYYGLVIDGEHVLVGAVATAILIAPR